MTRVLFAVAATVATLSGCASQARYVETQADAGVVAIPSNTDFWPTYNRHAAMALIEKHVGPNYEIVEEREIATGQQTLNNQQVNGNQSTNQVTTQNVTEWRIAYRKRAGAQVGSMMGIPSLPGSGGVQQTRYQPGAGSGVQPAGGIVPSMAPGAGVQPAGGAMGSGAMGSGAMGGGMMPAGAGVGLGGR